MAIRGISNNYGSLPPSTFNGPVTLAAGNPLIFGKSTDPGTAPGAGLVKMFWVAGTTGGTAKLIAYAGTSTTPTTIVDNVGSGF